MRGSSFHRFVAVALATVMLTIAVPLHAGGTGIPQEIPEAAPTAGAAPSPESAAGVVGAIVCGGGGWLIRTNPALGMNPYVLAATLAGCLLMLLDCL